MRARSPSPSLPESQAQVPSAGRCPCPAVRLRWVAELGGHRFLICASVFSSAKWEFSGRVRGGW